MTYEECRKNIDGKMFELVCALEVEEREKWIEKLKREYSTLSKANEAVDKRIAAKPLVHKLDADTKIGYGVFKAGVTIHKCPDCESFVLRSSKFCGNCGQALDWGDQPTEKGGEQE